MVFGIDKVPEMKHNSVVRSDVNVGRSGSLSRKDHCKRGSWQERLASLQSDIIDPNDFRGVSSGTGGESPPPEQRQLFRGTSGPGDRFNQSSAHKQKRGVTEEGRSTRSLVTVHLEP